jgi:hypothetical protein
MPANGFSSDDPWVAAISAGHFAKAWEISDDYLRKRLAGNGPPDGTNELQQIWRGEPLAGKRVLVRCHHGLGDTVQFIRFAEPLRRIARKVTVLAQGELLPLVATASGIDRALPLQRPDPQLTFDADVEVMELPHALRADRHMIRGRFPYLFPPDCGPPPRWTSRTGRRRVGIVWRAGAWDENRSLPAALLSPLSEVSEIELFSLQRGPAAEQAARIPAIDLGSDDVAATAATLLRLDLLISVDTFVAHLAGALGVPVWLLLQRHCDWRWMGGRADSVWYPTMRLFRQAEQNNWPPVIAAVAAALERITISAESQSAL